MTAINNYNDVGALQGLRTQAGLDPKEAAHEVAQQFESVFISMMLKTMRDTVPQDSLFGSHTMDSYQNMFDQQVAVDMSVKGGIGLADIIERQLLASGSLPADTADGMTGAAASIAGKE